MIATLLGHDFLSEAWAARRKKGGGGLSLTGARERRPRVNAGTPTTLPGFPPSRLGTGLLASGAKGREACRSFRQKFASAARCLAGRSGFQVALGGGLLECFSLPEFSPCFPCTPSQCCGINFTFVNSFPCSVKCLSTSSLET